MASAPPPPLPQLIDRLFRHGYGRMVAALARIFGPAHLDLAEDVVQEALLRAMKVWPYEGVPQRPRAWLVRVAKNLATDAIRRRAVGERVEAELQRWAAADGGGAPRPPDEIADDALRMIFACCHPALPPPSRVALTLKTLCGFGVEEIAAALLHKPATIAQRLSRAKALLREQGVAFELPAAAELGSRLTSVLEVLYLMFNEGYRAQRGDDLVRADLVQEAVRLCALLLEMPETRQPRVHALLALMLFGGARLPARVGACGELLTLSSQDRSHWDRAWLAPAFAHFRASIAGDVLTAYHAEAAIAACHATAPRYEDTDWAAILVRYDHLLQLHDTPVVRLNRAVAIAKLHGPRAGLAALEALRAQPPLRRYFLLPATRAQLLWSAGDTAAARAAYREALALDCTAPERAFLRDRLAACERGEAAPAF